MSLAGWFARSLYGLDFQCRRQRHSMMPGGLEILEDRTLLSLQFTPGPYAAPGERPDTPLGAMITGRPLEPYVSVNEQDPGQVAVSTQSGVRTTTNDGHSFSGVGTFPNSTEGDTSTTWDGAGRLFWTNLSTAGISIAQINPATGTVIPGTNFTVDNGGSTDDKDFLAADPNTNNLYVIWTRFLPGSTEVRLTRSTDQGAHWSRAVRVDSGGDGFVWPATVAVAPNGYVFAAYHSQIAFGPAGRDGYGNPTGTSGTILVVRYNNDLTAPLRREAFASGRADITFNVQSALTRKLPQTRFWTQGSAQPWILADPARPGHIYIIAADDPTNGVGAPYARIVFAQSINDGLTWSSPRPDGEIAPLDGSSFQLFPTASLDAFGDLFVAWYDNRRGLVNSSGRFLLDVYASYSTDGGQTFAPAFPVNDPNNPMDPDQGTVNLLNGPPPTTRIGEYFGSGIFGDTAYLAWNGNSISTGEQVFFKAIAIQGALTVTGTGGDDTLTIQSMPQNSDYAEILVNGQRQYTGLCSGLTGITVVAGPGNETINLEDTPAGVPVTIDLGSGSDAVNLSPGAQNLDTIGGTVTVYGGSGADSLVLSDQASTAGRTFTVADTTITSSGTTNVTYNNLASLAILAGNGGTTFEVQGTSVPLTLKGGAGKNTLLGTSAANTLNIEAANAGLLSSADITGTVAFTSIQNLKGGTGANRFVFSDTAAVSGTIDGGGGGTLDYSAYSSSVIVDLQTGTATGVGGGISNIVNVTGGGGGGSGVYNILVGDGGNALTGGNGRRNLLIAGASASTFLGGDDDDILIGGTTAYDLDVAALVALMNYWSGTADDYATRVGNLLAGHGMPLLDPATVTSNGGGNTLTGGPGLNLYFGNAADTTDFDPNSGALFVPL